MCKGELRELCLKQTTTNKGRKQEFYEIELHGAKPVCWLPVN